MPLHKPVFIVGNKMDKRPPGKPSLAFGSTMATLMQGMNELHPQSFVVMTSAAKPTTVLQLCMRIQVAALYPVALLLQSRKVKVRTVTERGERRPPRACGAFL